MGAMPDAIHNALVHLADIGVLASMREVKTP